MRALHAACGLMALLIMLSHLGGIFPPGDTLAVIRPHLLLGLTLSGGLSLVLRARLTGLVALALALITTGPVVLPFLSRPPPETAPYTLYQKNLLAKAWPRAPLAKEILASDAQIVTLQELSDHNQKFMPALFKAYPGQIICPFRNSISVAILSRFDPVPGSASCGQEDGLALMQVRLPDGHTLWLASLHLHWPWPYRQPAQLDRVLARLEALEGPVLLAGDFNMVPWGHSVRRIARATNTDLAGPSYITFSRFSPVLPLAIDHILLPATARGQVDKMPLHGSDHNGLLLRFSL